MTIKDRIVHYLMTHPEGIDDDDLARVLNLSARQQANSRCRQLQEEGLVIRCLYRGKIYKFWAGVDIPVIDPVGLEEMDELSDKHKDWFWEGNIQSLVIGYLVDLATGLSLVLIQPVIKQV